MPTTPLREIVQLADSALASGDFAEALRRCDQALQASPRWIDLLCVRAEALSGLNRIAEAIQLIDLALTAHPESPRAFYARAHALERQGDRMGEMACYRRICDLVPEDGGARSSYDHLAVQLGRPPFSPTQAGLARLYLRSHLYVHALREWDTVLRANPARIDAQVGIAETFWRMGEPMRAIEICQSILQPMPLCVKPLLIVAEVELRQGHHEEARRNFRLAGELDPELAIAGELFADLVAAGDRVLAQALRETSRSLTVPILSRLQITSTTGPQSGSPPGPGRSDSARSQEAAPATGSWRMTHPTGSNPAINRSGLAPSTRPFNTGPLPAGLAPTSPLFPPTDPTALTSKLAPNTPPDRSTRPFAGAGPDSVPGDGFFSRSRASQVPEEVQRVYRETENMLWRADRADSHPPADRVSGDRKALAPDNNELDFVQWLQAQGAQPISTGGEPVSDPASAIITPPPFLIEAMRQSAPPASIVPEPLSPAAPETVVSGLAPLVEPAFAASVAAIPLPPADPDVDAPVMRWPVSEPVEIASRVAVPPFRAPGGDSTPPLEPSPPLAIAMPAPPSADPAALTIEAIEEGLTAGGFARLDTGRLASVASMLDTVAPEEHGEIVDVPARIEHARTLRYAGKRAEALGELRHLVKADLTDLPVVVRALLDAAIEAPNEPEVYRLLGDAQIRLGNYVESLDAYNRASALQRETP